MQKKNYDIFRTEEPLLVHFIWDLDIPIADKRKSNVTAAAKYFHSAKAMLVSPPYCNSRAFVVMLGEGSVPISLYASWRLRAVV